MPDLTKVLHLVSADCEWEPAFRIAGLAAALREHGLHSAVTAPEHSRLWEFAEAAGVEIVPHAVENSANPLRWRELSKLIKEFEPGVVHVHDTEAARLLSRAGMFGSPAAVVTTRYDLRTQPVSAEYGKGVKAVICPSQALADVFVKSAGSGDAVKVVFDGVNLAAADRSLEERDELRIKYRDAYCPQKEKPLFLVNISPLEADSHHADVLEAFSEVVAALPQSHLFIMGEGGTREELERQIRIMALEKDVSILEPDKAFNRLLAVADLYVAASGNDVSGFMLQAAMASGRAAAVAKAGCYEELAENGKTGVFAAGSDAEALKNAMMELLQNRTRREHLGRMAKARAVKMFNIATQAGIIADIYRESVPVPSLRKCS